MAESASDLRQRGNFEFSAGNYDHALALYTAALEHCQCDGSSSSNTTHTADEDPNIREERILNLCNRSACYSQQEEWELSKQDAAEAWELSDHKSVKAAYRLSKTSLVLKEFETAKKTIQAALKRLDEMELTPLPANNDEKPDVPDRRRQIEEAEAKQQTETASSMHQPPDVSQQRRSLQDLWKQLLKTAYADEINKNDAPEMSIKYAKRPISIKEFQTGKDLGFGNFSEILTVTHKVTGERFALKKIAKKQAADLAKRQHPNVYNEIQMERRVLLERLSSPGHPFIVRMYHAFQDYNNLYYLMDLHEVRGDLWSQLRYKNLPGYGDTEAMPMESLVMMGCHRSTARLWLYELVSALEYIHSRGVVHRDLKPENLLLDSEGHIIVIDFGTAKDLVLTDLNGPEFVGTPDFMSPEAVMGKDPPGTSSVGREKEETAVEEAGPAADLWALGAICFQLQTGHTPYWCPSPYLAFLKIKRSQLTHNLLRSLGIIDDDCWDFITSMMKGKPADRLGADVFVPVWYKGRRRMERKGEGYDIIRQHPYFTEVRTEMKSPGTIRSKALPIPTLSDLCIRAVAEMAYRDSLDLKLCDRHPPGDGSKHDLLRLKPRERAAVMHVLDRRRLLAEPRLFARFFADTISARLDKVRPNTHSFVGLEQMNDEQGKPPKAKMHDQYATPIEMDPIQIVHLTNPLFATTEATEIDEATRKIWTKLLKKCVANVNRNRPKLVVVVGRVDAASRKILARISETIPVVVHDGSTFFTFWMSGVQCIALRSSSLIANNGDDDTQMYWLREQLEQVRMSKHPLYVFVDADPRTLPQRVLKKLARGRALCLYGLVVPSPPSDQEYDNKKNVVWESTIAYKANETISAGGDGVGSCEDDAVSIRSTDSEEDEADSFIMKVTATCANGLRWITVEEEPDKWSSEFKEIELPPPAAETGTAI